MPTGTLRKRRRRNLAKVTGLSLVPYEEEDINVDLFRIPERTRTHHLNKSAIVWDNLGRSGLKTGDPLLPPDLMVSIDESEESGVTDTREESNGHHPDETIINVTSEFRGTVEDEAGNTPNGPGVLKPKTLRRFKMLMFLGLMCGAFPWRWNEKKMRVDLFTPKLLKAWFIFWRIFSVQTFLITIFQFYVMYIRATGEHSTYRQIFMASLSLYWYFIVALTIITMDIHREGIRTYINTMMFTNKIYGDKYIVSTDTFEEGGRIFMHFGIFFNMTQPFASTILFCIMPYQPWYLYSYVYKESHPWYFRIPGAFQEFLVVGNCITGYVLYTWLTISHSNTAQFWLRETHKHNDASCTVNELREQRTSLQMYRSLQVLCGLFNESLSPLALPVMMLFVILGIIPCGYVLIRSMGQVFLDEFPGILTYPIGVVDCFTTGFCLLSMSAYLYDLGVSFVDSWSRTKQKELRQILRSLPALKVWVGRYYFITVTSTITVFKITLDYVIDCIITFP